MGTVQKHTTVTTNFQQLCCTFSPRGCDGAQAGDRKNCQRWRSSRVWGWASLWHPQHLSETNRLCECIYELCVLVSMCCVHMQREYTHAHARVHTHTHDIFFLSPSSLRSMFTCFTHFLTKDTISFLCMTKINTTVCVYHILFTHSSVDGHLRWLYNLANRLLFCVYISSNRFLWQSWQDLKGRPRSSWCWSLQQCVHLTVITLTAIILEANLVSSSVDSLRSTPYQ